MDISAEIKKASDAMTKATQHVDHEFESVHTGKANPGMVENVMVEAYGTMSRLRDVAAITTPDSSTIRCKHRLYSSSNGRCSTLPNPCTLW